MIKIETAKMFLDNGISVIPIDSSKKPTLSSWKVFQSRRMLDEELMAFNSQQAVNIGIVAGESSGNLEMIDIDCKYDITGTLYERYMEEIPEQLKNRLIIQTTINKGYHLIYRCSQIEGNKKLAQRDTTLQEQKDEVEKALVENLKLPVDKQRKPEQIKPSKVKDLFETRGQGGYFLVQPSKGYKIIQGKLSEIPLITEIEREYLISLARSFNEVTPEQPTPTQVTKTNKFFHISPFDDYDQKCDVPSLLEEHGWTIAKKQGSGRYYMKRPGTENPYSATYDRDKNWFTVFSSSTEFEPLKAYKPYAVWATLNGISDWLDVSKELSKQGYGIKNDAPKPKEKVSNFEAQFEDDGDVSFAHSWSDIRLIVEEYVSGRLTIGLDTGYYEFDEYFRFKAGNLVIVNGFDNTGKTTIIIWLAVISAIRHGWKWALYSSENSELNIMNMLIQYFICKPIRQCTIEERDEAQIFIERHFVLIRADELISYKTLKNQVAKIHKYNNLNGLLIDPFNSLDNTESANTHEFNYSVVTDMKLWGRKNNVSIFLNVHSVTGAARNIDADEYVKVPSKYSAEGGVKFANKADDFLTIHRITNHENVEERKITEIHVQKIKDTMTGGKITGKTQPFRLVWGNGGSVFYSENYPGMHPFKTEKLQIDFEDMLNDPEKLPF